MFSDLLFPQPEEFSFLPHFCQTPPLFPAEMKTRLSDGRRWNVGARRTWACTHRTCPPPPPLPWQGRGAEQGMEVRAQQTSLFPHGATGAGPLASQSPIPDQQNARLAGLLKWSDICDVPSILCGTLHIQKMGAKRQSHLFLFIKKIFFYFTIFYRFCHQHAPTTGVRQSHLKSSGVSLQGESVLRTPLGPSQWQWSRAQYLLCTKLTISGSELWFWLECSLLTGELWPSFLTFLSLSFLIYKMGT